MIDVIVFSKDRAAQLDMMLSGLKHYLKEWQSQSYTILFTYTNDLHKLSYDRVISLHPEKCFTWVKENNFQRDVINIFNSGKNAYCSFLVDDDVFINKFSLEDKEVKEFMRNDQIACVSPRIYPKVDYCYTARLITPPPKNFINKTIWNWKEPGLAGDWNYVFSIASFHIFRREDLAGPINKVPFRAPNSFEGTCLAPTNLPRPLMICFEQQKVLCGTNNRVQTENNNYHENSHPIDILAKNFLMGKRLDYTANNNVMKNACHGNIRMEYYN